MITLNKNYNLDDQLQAEYDETIRNRCRRIKSLRELEFEAIQEQLIADELYYQYLQDKSARQGEEYYYSQS